MFTSAKVDLERQPAEQLKSAWPVSCRKSSVASLCSLSSWQVTPFKVFTEQNFLEIPLRCDPLPQLASFRTSFSVVAFSAKKCLFRLDLCLNECDSAEFCLTIQEDAKIFDY